MRKILGMLLVLITLTLGLTSCVSSDGLNEYKRDLDDAEILIEELQDEVEVLKSSLQELQLQIDTTCPIQD